MTQAATFEQFADQFGGLLNSDDVFSTENGLHWLNQIMAGLGSLVAHYQGDKNRCGDIYQVRHGLFDRMEINGVADRTHESLAFGITLGALLRLMHIQRLLVLPTPHEKLPDFLEYFLTADPDDTEPQNADEVLSCPLPTHVLSRWQDRTFFSTGFVFMHEAFHTLIGHADYARVSFQLGLDELDLDRETGDTRHLIQAMELEADGAAFSNFWFTLRQNPKFGVCPDPQPDPVDRIAEATISGMTALLALEARRVRRSQTRELRHPFPSRRITSILRLLLTYERHGRLPKGCRNKLAEKARSIRPLMANMAIIPLIDLLANEREIATEDTEYLRDLIALYRSELQIFEKLSYAPRITIADP